MKKDPWKLDCPWCGQSYEESKEWYRRSFSLKRLPPAPHATLQHLYCEVDELTGNAESVWLSEIKSCKICGKKCGFDCRQEVWHLRKYHTPEELTAYHALAILGLSSTA